MRNKKIKIGLPLAMAALLLVSLFAAACSNSAGNANGKKTPTPAKTPGIPAEAPPGATPPNSAGSPTASVTIEEFADFQCPTCALTYPIMDEIKAAYGSRIQFIYRNFPLKIPAHDKTYEASVAAEAAGMQGKFFEMARELYANQREWTANPNYKGLWKSYAEKIGLNVEQWQNDAVGLPAKQRVDLDLKRGDAIGINSTPTVFLNNVAVPPSKVTVSGLKELIDAELAKNVKPAAPAANSAPEANSNASEAKKPASEVNK
ncbi:MAG: protein-disulfide isomerase [Acidobacteria bacterium OLB17]|nr:MAG: protein-disulfide isomerase [Acidobacteria bacterium OLB17]MCZ2390276.1 DsbA family protein [Acidobacteriota bacterium]